MEREVRYKLIFDKMKAKDLEEVLTIEQDSFSHPWTRGMFLQEINVALSHFFVARVLPSREMIGYAGFWQVVDELHLVNLAVNPVYRRQKAGEKLLSYVLAYGKALGLKRATLEVRISNLAAQKLYEEAGFKAVAMRKGYYSDTQEDAIIMWQELLA